MKKKFYIEILFLVIIGAITSFSLPPFNYIFLNFLTLSLFLIFMISKKKSVDSKKFFLYGWSFGFGYFSTNLYWISLSLTFDINFKFLFPVTLVLIPFLISIFYGIATYLFFIIKTKNPISDFFLFSFLIGIIEFLKGNILTGFPWNLFAYSYSKNLEILQILSLIGTYSFNIICISIFTVPALFILRKGRKEIIICTFFLLLPIFLFITGSLKIKSFNEIDLTKNDYVIRAISSKIALDRFYGNTDPLSVINELIELSEPDLNTKTLFLWPEGIIPNVNQSELKEFKFLFDQKLNQNHLLGLGINSIKNENNKKEFYNSFSFYDHELNLIDSYNKVKLVPFGEFLPFKKILGFIGLNSLTNNYQPYNSGIDREIIVIENNNSYLKILPLICYEIIYSGQIFNNPDFDYIINISEDGWFGNSIGPYQHYTHSIFRAIESGKYLIRSANNGITAIINPTGLAEKKIDLGNSGYIDFSEKRVSTRTLFSQHGNIMFLIIILLYIFLIFSFNRISS